MSFLIGVLVLVVGLIVSIALHEIGHLVPAKRFGVKVTEYFVGFGPTLWSRRRGETLAKPARKRQWSPTGCFDAHSSPAPQPSALGPWCPEMAAPSGSYRNLCRSRDWTGRT